MELVVQLLLFLVILSSLLQYSQWSWRTRLIPAVVFSALAFWVYPWILQQSKDDLIQWLDNPIHLQNLAVVLVIETLIFITIDLMLVKSLFLGSSEKLLRWLRFFPGVMLIGVVLYTEMMAFYTFNEIEYKTLAVYYSVFVGVVLLEIPPLFKWLIPEDHLRLELRYLVGFGQVLTGIAMTILIQKIPYSASQASIEWPALLTVVGLALTFFVVGWIWPKLKTKLTIKWKF